MDGPHAKGATFTFRACDWSSSARGGTLSFMGGKRDLRGRWLRMLMMLPLALLALSCGEEFGASVEDGSDSGTGNCIPTSCDKQGAQCGTAPDGCGETVQCGSCPAGEVCGGGGQNKCGKNLCTPVTCADLGATCGVASDGCGATLQCGNCSAPETCGGGGEPNKCGCKPLECEADMCGKAPDGCGGLLQCGDKCPSGEICGGGGANRCGTNPCTPKTCAGEGVECGNITDGCGNGLNCGQCTPPQTCGGGGVPKKCGCTPTTCAALGRNCGAPADLCGGTLSCGTCTGSDTCGGGGTPGVCGCTKTACGPKECGVKSDGCGGTQLCTYECTGGLLCDNTQNKCVSCVAGVCTGATECITSQPCDGTINTSMYCPCLTGTCNTQTGKCDS